jgi:hypothetical protein
MKQLNSKQLTSLEIKPFREALFKKQKGVCPLCKQEMELHEATLDHSYLTGRCRAVLHRSCNGSEGQILKWAGQRSKGQDPVEFIKNLARYWQKEFSHNPLHPKHGKPKPKRKKKRKPVGKRIKSSVNSRKTANTQRNKPSKSVKAQSNGQRQSPASY